VVADQLAAAVGENGGHLIQGWRSWLGRWPGGSNWPPRGSPESAATVNGGGEPTLEPRPAKKYMEDKVEIPDKAQVWD
jgi:hypothetical protein